MPLSTQVLNDPMSAALARVLDLREQQHATLVSNLANADTPGYLARRLDFREALAEVAREATSPSGARGEPGFQAEPRVDLEEAPPWSADGNSVNPEQEAMLLEENNVMYGAVVEVLRRRYATLEYAIHGNAT